MANFRRRGNSSADRNNRGRMSSGPASTDTRGLHGPLPGSNAGSSLLSGWDDPPNVRGLIISSWDGPPDARGLWDDLSDAGGPDSWGAPLDTRDLSGWDDPSDARGLSGWDDPPDAGGISGWDEPPASDDAREGPDDWDEPSASADSWGTLNDWAEPSGTTPSSFRGGTANRGGSRGVPTWGVRGRPRRTPLSFRGSTSRGSSLPTRGMRGMVRGRPTGIFMHGERAEIDARLADNSDKTAVASFNSSSSNASSHTIPLRPDFGTIGRVIKLRTNFFPVHIQQGSSSLNMYAYDVAIFPAVTTAVRRVKRRIFALAEKTTEWAQAGLIGRVVHNGSDKLFSATQLPQPLTIRVPYHDEDASGPPRQDGNEYTLVIVSAQEIDTQSFMSYLAGQKQYRNYNILPVVSALSAILKSLPEKESILIGQNRYFSRRGAELYRLGSGIEAWKGIYAPTLRPTYKQLMINVDVCTSAFYTPGNLAHAMNAFQEASFGSRMDYFFRGVRIETIHSGSQKTVKSLAPHTARSCSFDISEYSQVTIEEYFRRRYNIRLQYPDMQLVNLGGQIANYLPAELCYIIPGQPFCRKVSDEQSTMLGYAGHRPPSKRGETTINQLRHKFGLDVIRPELDALGITIGPDMAVVPGRILPKPGIMYASSVTASVGDQAFWNLLGVKFAVGAHLDHWAVLAINEGHRDEFNGPSNVDPREIMFTFRQMCDASGLRITREPVYAVARLPRDHEDPMRRGAVEIIKNTLLSVRPKPVLVLIMLANGDKAIYDGVKHLCDVFLDVATVCVQSPKLRRRKPHSLASMVSKVNMKLGGTNHRLDVNARKWLTGARTMVVGMYIMRPSPGSVVGCPSISAVVASVDEDFVQYPVTLNIQDSCEKLIMDLRSMMVDRLKLFQRKNDGNLPERVLIYHGGVSVNQFNSLLETELLEILEAFKAVVGPGTVYRPKTTLVACSKSRRVRFYPTQQDDALRDGNTLPGTVVDRGVTDTYDFDFFLQSHGDDSLGTTRPTHYHVVYDENQLKADDIQGVTHALSYVFGRATQAVSVACPVHYAREACQRGRCYLRKLSLGYDVGSDEAAATTTTAGTKSGNRSQGVNENATEGDVFREAQRLWRWGVSGAGLKDTMFYL